MPIKRAQRVSGGYLASEPCKECARVWIDANRYGKLPIFPILEPGLPPIRQTEAIEHLRRVHHLGGSDFVGVYGVWVCGILSGLNFSDDTAGSTFADRVRSEISYRQRLYPEFLKNIRRGVNYLWGQGILTLQSIRHAARELHGTGGPTRQDLEAATLSYRALVMWAFRKAKETVKP